MSNPNFVFKPLLLRLNPSKQSAIMKLNELSVRHYSYLLGTHHEDREPEDGERNETTSYRKCKSINQSIPSINQYL